MREKNSWTEPRSRGGHGTGLESNEATLELMEIAAALRESRLRGMLNCSRVTRTGLGTEVHIFRQRGISQLDTSPAIGGSFAVVAEKAAIKANTRRNDGMFVCLCSNDRNL